MSVTPDPVRRQVLDRLAALEAQVGAVRTAPRPPRRTGDDLRYEAQIRLAALAAQTGIHRPGAT